MRNIKIKRRLWTEKEEKFIKENYLKFGFKEIGKKLNRSHSSILHKASKLNLKNGYKKSKSGKRKMSKTRIKKIKRGDKDIKIFQGGEMNIIHNPIIKEKARKGIMNAWSDGRYDEYNLSRKGKPLIPKRGFMKGFISHCTGKTKENYEPLRKIAEKVSGTRKRLFNEGKLKPIIEKGQTLEDKYGEEKAKQIREKQSKTRTSLIRSGKIKNYTPVKNSSIEVKIQNFLKKLGIEFFTHQYMKIEHGYQCDILIPSMNMVIECDGDYWHKYPIGLERDRIRTKELIEKGFKVLRLWEFEIKEMDINQFQKRISL